MEIICHNTQGFPSDKNNIFKLKGIKVTIGNADAMIILETGNNGKQNLLIPDSRLEISKENHMLWTEKG